MALVGYGFTSLTSVSLASKHLPGTEQVLSKGMSIDRVPSVWLLWSPERAP